MAIDLDKCFGESSNSSANRVILNPPAQKGEYDFLLFFDSRGLGVEKECELNKAHLALTQEWLKGIGNTFLSISRPKNLTTFATLHNFLKSFPELTFKRLVTNLGIVDCTPKKRTNIIDLEGQFNQYALSGYKLVEACEFMLENGQTEQLFHFSYNEIFVKKISEVLRKRFSSVLFISTPVIDPEEQFSRTRPAKFYSQLETTNDLIAKICNRVNGSEILDLNLLKGLKTYDAVHFTSQSHSFLFRAIVERLG